MQFSESSLDKMSSKMIIFAFNQCFLYPNTITFTQSFQSIVVCRKPSIYSHRRTCLLLSLRDPHGFPESCQPWVHSLLVYLSLSKVQTPADPPFLHLSLSFFPAPQPLFLSNSHQRAHTHKKNTNWHARPPISQPSLYSLFPSTSHHSTLCPSNPLSHPLPYASPSLPPSLTPVAESTGGSSRYMYSRLLCGRHDNRHEFDMALTYPGGCEPVWMQRFEWRSRI